jgi:hypothetical protein
MPDDNFPYAQLAQDIADAREGSNSAGAGMISYPPECPPYRTRRSMNMRVKVTEEVVIRPAKMKWIAAILKNPTYLPDSGLYQQCAAALNRLPVLRLRQLLTILEQNECKEGKLVIGPRGGRYVVRHLKKGGRPKAL